MKRFLKSVKRSVKAAVFPIIYPRRIHAYCVGAMKSGTTSMAGLFSRHYRAQHEPEVERIVRAAMAAAQGRLSEKQKTAFIRKRDNCLRLELDSSVFNNPFLDVYVREFPEAKFILTIRDVYSWLDSCFNHQLSRDVADYVQAFLDGWLDPRKYDYAPQEQILRERGLFSVDCYLNFWDRLNRHALDTVPPDRLLIVRTKEILTSIPRVADFLGIPPDTLDGSSAHLFKSKEKFDILSQLDKSFVEDRVRARCKNLMDRFFPDVRGIENVRSPRN